MDFTKTKITIILAILVGSIITGLWVIHPSQLGLQRHGISVDEATGKTSSKTLPALGLLDWDWNTAVRLDQFSDSQVEFRVESMTAYNLHKAETDDLIVNAAKPALGHLLSDDLGITFTQHPLTVYLAYDGQLWGAAGGGVPNVAISGGSWVGRGLSIAKGIVIGESVNILTGILSGGWPVDWWVDCFTAADYCVWNFPTMVTYNILQELGLSLDAAVFHDPYDSSTPVFNMFNNIKQAYGWGAYKRMFQAVKADGVNWFGINPNAHSDILTNYVLAYLEIGAGADLSQSIGQVAGIYHGIAGYDRTMVNDIKGARSRIQSISRSELAWSQFLSGDYKFQTTNPPPPTSGGSGPSVCTYQHGSGTWTVNGLVASDGGLLHIPTGSSVPLVATSGSLSSWDGTDGVHVASTSSPSTTVTFDDNGRATCVGNLVANFGTGGGSSYTISLSITPTSGSATTTIYGSVTTNPVQANLAVYLQVKRPGTSSYTDLGTQQQLHLLGSMDLYGKFTNAPWKPSDFGLTADGTYYYRVSAGSVFSNEVAYVQGGGTGSYTATLTLAPTSGNPSSPIGFSLQITPSPTSVLAGYLQVKTPSSTNWADVYQVHASQSVNVWNIMPQNYGYVQTGTYTFRWRTSDSSVTSNEVVFTMGSQPSNVQADLYVNGDKVQNGGSVTVAPPFQFKVVITSGSVSSVRVMVDNTSYPLTSIGSNTYISSAIQVGTGNHIVKFEYNTGGIWSPLALLAVGGGTPITSNLILPVVGIALAVIAVIIYVVRRRNG